MKKIAIEEHFLTERYLDFLRSRKDYPKIEIVDGEERVCSSPNKLRYRYSDVTKKLVDLGEGRLREMDEAGIDMQVLSLYWPVVDLLDNTTEAISMVKKTNDDLAEVVTKYPDRFAGFAALARHDPNESACELERAVGELGFKGHALVLISEENI